MENTIKLQTDNNSELEISLNAAKQSSFLLEKIEKGEKVIKVPHVRESTLESVIEYLTHYLNNEAKPLPTLLESDDLRENLNSDWDFEFIDRHSFEETFHLINAGIMFGLERLHDLACCKIASFMKDKNADEINQEFTIECQITTEEATKLGLD